MRVYILYENDPLMASYSVPSVHSIYLSEEIAIKEKDRLMGEGEYFYTVSEEVVIK